MEISNYFKVNVCSDQDYNELIAEIYFAGNILAIIDQENGFENLKISIFPNKTGNWNFPFLEFMEVLEYTKAKLWKLRRSDLET